MSDLLIAYHDPAMRIIEIREFARTGADGTGRAWQYVSRQPNWIVRAALTAFALILALPIFLLLLFAMLAAVVVFAVLVLANAVLGAVRSILPRNDGRSSNIRVVRREE